MNRVNHYGRLSLFIGMALWASSALTARAQTHGTFAATGNMLTPRFNHTATLLYDGRVLIAGGDSNAGTRPRGIEIFDPATGEFAQAGDASYSPRGAVLLPSGNVMMLSFSESRTLFAEIYNPKDQTIIDRYALSETEFVAGLQIYYAGLLPSGRILVLTSSPLYHGVHDIFELSENPTSGRFLAAKKDDFFINYFEQGETFPLADGRVLIATFPSRIYDPKTGVLGLVGSGGVLPFGCYGYTGTLLTTGKVLTSGGDCDFGPMRIAGLYDPATNSFSATNGMHVGRHNHSITLLGDGNVLIAGGNTGAFTAPPYSELYDPATGSFSFGSDMALRRLYHSATLLADGRVLLAGGFGPVPGQQPWGMTNTAEIYTPDVLPAKPALLSLSGDGMGQGAILRAGSGRPAAPGNPTRTGEALEIYLTGLLDGAVIPPQVSIGGRLAEVLYFGRAPGVANTNQINVRVPAGIAPGPAMPVRLMYLGRPSNEVTIAVQ